MRNCYVPPPPAPLPTMFGTASALADYLINCKEPEVMRLCGLPCNDYLLDGFCDGWAGLQDIEDAVERIAARRNAFMHLIMEQVREGQAAWQAGFRWPPGTRRVFTSSC